MIVISDDEEATARLVQLEEDEALARSLQVGRVFVRRRGASVGVLMIVSAGPGPVRPGGGAKLPAATS